MTSSLETRVGIRVPGNAFAGDAPLVAVMRGDYPGSLHRGTLAVVDASGRPDIAIGDIAQPAYLRSAAKPFQVMPAILAGALEGFGITERELAVLCASHSAKPHHAEAVLSILEKLDLDEQALQCGVHAPLHAPTAERRVAAGLAPTPVCNNCSGAHAGMLAACRARGWPIESYGSPDHPLQRETREIIAAFAELPTHDVAIAIDNCHVPAFRIPVRSAAQAFARLVTGRHLPSELRAAARRVVSAMTGHPEMVAGEDRFDSDLMAAAGGSVVSKGGAEAFQAIGLAQQGLGLALKISDGNARAVPPASLRVLDAYGVPGIAGLEKYRTPELRDWRGDVVGRIIPVFSLDNPR